DDALGQGEVGLVVEGRLQPLHCQCIEFHKSPIITGLYWRRPRKGRPAVGRTMTAPVAPDLARIPAGDFLMGAADAEEDERPVHRVYVSEFFIGRFPVTQDEYARFIGATGYPAPAIRGLPLVTTGGRDSLFREMAASSVWEQTEPPAGHGSPATVLL